MPPVSAGPSWLGPPWATDLLQRASRVLAEQSWPDDGQLRWFGWGEPSAELLSSMPGRWVKMSTHPTGEPATAASAGIHVMVERLSGDRAERLDGLARLWNEVKPDGLLALTYPVAIGPTAPEAASVVADDILVDHQRLVEDLLLAASGRILAADMVVHHPPFEATGTTWATLVLRRLR